MAAEALGTGIDGFVPKVEKSEGCQRLAENVLNFLGCGDIDQFAHHLLRGSFGRKAAVASSAPGGALRCETAPRSVTGALWNQGTAARGKWKQ
ncbi:hypothetical protein ANANG_G00144680 [Anguilla anguilla]|uniref:Uncharacterized protein n=1 Tax=Anguilla anguilla TaxID=7936 RepID=A0A9D3MEC2_ANGAN|nr:hypothetical protein ANANG_G00144680 [Anguilla anguilla]